MTCYCLIPVTRPWMAERAMINASCDRWTVLTMDGSRGVQETRRLLLERAILCEADYIRYSDDDDTGVMPHREEAVKALENGNADIVYFDYRMDLGGRLQDVRYSGDLGKDLKIGLGIAPWAWVAKTKSLKKMRIVWDLTVKKTQGTWMILQAMSAGLKIVHIPKLAYYYTPFSVEPNITKTWQNSKIEDFSDWLSEALVG